MHKTDSWTWIFHFARPESLIRVESWESKCSLNGLLVENYVVLCQDSLQIHYLMVYFHLVLCSILSHCKEVWLRSTHLLQ